MAYALCLRCVKCGREFPLDEYSFRCFDCNEPLEVVYDYDSLRKFLGRESFVGEGLWRYRFLLPVKGDVVSLGEGGSPLLGGFRIARVFGFRGLFLKDEGRNPTGSFKDRGSSVGVSKALEVKARFVGCASTGNMAASLSAYANKAGLKCIILVPHGTPMEKLLQILYYDPMVFSVDLPYPELYKMSFEMSSKYNVFLVHSDNPFRVEGQKTIAFEICEQLNWMVPDFVVVPTSSGGNFSAIWKGFMEFYNLGLIDKLPRMVCVQSDGCAPIVEAFKSGDDLKAWVNPETIAHSISNPNPALASGNRVLRILREYNGIAVSVSDQEISEAQKMIAILEGLFVEPASAASIAALKKLLNMDLLHSDTSVVCVLTGIGLKDMKVIRSFILHPTPIKSWVEFEERLKKSI